MPARGRKRKNVSSSEEEDESSLESSSEESEQTSEESEEEEDEDVVRKPRGRGKAPPPKKKAPAKKKPAAKAPPKKRGRPAKKQVEEEEEVAEEEELDDAAAPSNAALNEEDENDPGFDSSLFKDEADKAYLSSLPEVEREKVLAERYDRWQRYEEWKRLRAERAGAPSTSTSARRNAAQQAKSVQIESDEEDEPKPRKQQQAAATTTTTTSISKARQEEKEESEDEDGDEVSSEGDHAIPGKEESDEEEEDPEEDQLLDLPTASSILLSRKQILEWMDYPSSKFNAGLVGCFVKILLDDKTERYGLRQITKVVTSDVNPYVVDREGVLFHLKVKGGPKARTTQVSLSKVSNKPLTEAEMIVYSREYPLNTLTRRRAKFIAANLKKCLSEYVLTGKDVLRMIESRKMRQGDTSVLSRSVGLTLVGRKQALTQEIAQCNRERVRLASSLEHLESKAPKDEDEEDDDERVRERDGILDQLRDVNEQLTRLEQELKKVEAHISRDADKRLVNEISLKLNERNEERNRANIVQVEEHKRKVFGFVTQGGGSIPAHLSLRRPTRPRMMWDTSLGNAADQTTGAPDDATSTQPVSTATTTTTTTSSTDSNQVAPTATTTTTTTNDQVEEAAEDVEEDLSEVKPQQARLKMLPDAHIALSTATKKLTLEEYKRLKQQKQQQHQPAPQHVSRWG